MEPLLSNLESGVAQTRKLPAVGYGSDVRKWNDPRVFDHQLPLARRGPRSLPGSAQVNVLQLGHEVRVPQRIRAQLRAIRPPGTALRPGEDRTRSAGPTARLAMYHPRFPGATRHSLRSTTRVTRSSARLICQRHRDQRARDPDLARPLQEFQPHGCLLAYPTAWLTPRLEALMHRHGRHLRGSRMHAWQRPLEDTGTSALWSWRLRAACRHVDSAVFFPPDGERPPQREAREARAKAICSGCPVIRQCAAYAIRYGERYGVWGGMSERERAALVPGPGRALAAVRTVSADLSNRERGIR
jgi:WhiB family redox-sensing transcriptional regulator